MTNVVRRTLVVCLTNIRHLKPNPFVRFVGPEPPREVLCRYFPYKRPVHVACKRVTAKQHNGLVTPYYYFYLPFAQDSPLTFHWGNT